jgi:hypothetical protein
MPHIGGVELALVLGQIVLAIVAWLQRKDANQTRLRMQEVTAHSEAARRDDENMGSAINLASVMATNMQAQTTHFNALTAKLLGMDATLGRVHTGVTSLEEIVAAAEERMAAATADRVRAQTAILQAIEGVPARTASQVEDRLVGRFESLGSELVQLTSMSREISQVSQETNDKAHKLWAEWKDMAPQLRQWLLARSTEPGEPARAAASAAAAESTDPAPPVSVDAGASLEPPSDMHKEL